MRRRDDRDRLPGNIDPVTQTGLIDVRKTLGDELRRLVCDVEQHVVDTALFHLAVNGAGHHVARREGFQRMISVHELHGFDGLEYAAFAADGFADEK